MAPPPLLLLLQANAYGPRTSGRRQPMMPICLALYPSLRKKRLRKGKRQERAAKYRKYHACETKESSRSKVELGRRQRRRRRRLGAAALPGPASRRLPLPPPCPSSDGPCLEAAGWPGAYQRESRVRMPNCRTFTAPACC